MRPAWMIIAASSFLLACSGDVPDSAFVRARKTARPCGDEETQPAMTHCAQREARAAEAQLGQLMAELERSLAPARSAGLREIHQEWKRWRDRHCTWDAAAFEGGSIQPMWYANCVATETRQRIGALKYHLCPGSGMAGDCEASRRYDPEPDTLPRIS
jgi:uncharacterized protein YecT (DUF1311 family)